MKSKHESRIAVVTGAGKKSGIGYEVCRQLAQAGMTVVLTGRDGAAVEERTRELQAEGLDVRGWALDVTSASSVASLSAFLTESFGRVDVLVNNAAATSAFGERPSSADLERARESMDATLFGGWRVTQALVPLLERSKHGRVVNVSSGAGSHGDPAFGLTTQNSMGPAYAVSKAAVNALTVAFRTSSGPTASSSTPYVRGLRRLSRGPNPWGRGPCSTAQPALCGPRYSRMAARPADSTGTASRFPGEARAGPGLRGQHLGALHFLRVCSMLERDRARACLDTKDSMGILTFSHNVTLDGCVDHQEGIADDETRAFFTRLMDEHGAMLWGRVTYEMMEGYWPAVARGDVDAVPAMREWAVKLEAKPKYVASTTRRDFPWTNSHPLTGDLRTGVQRLKDETPAGVLLGSGKLATELDRLELIDEYQFLVHPRLAGHGPTLYQSGLPSARRLELLSVKPLRSGAVAMHYRRAV